MKVILGKSFLAFMLSRKMVALFKIEVSTESFNCTGENYARVVTISSSALAVFRSSILVELEFGN